MTRVLANKIGRYLRIDSHEPLSAELTTDFRLHPAMLKIDLNDYMSASKGRAESPEAARAFVEVRGELIKCVSTLHATNLWFHMLNEATQGMNEAEVQIIRASPVSQFMESDFVELVKNAIDEAILSGHLVIELTLDIDVHSDPDNITMTIKDNGRGFSDDFIKQMATPAEREKYIIGKGSAKQQLSHGIQDTLVGGHGRGLRNLMAMMDRGDRFNEAVVPVHEYLRPDGTNMVIDKRPDGLPGAFISLTTSKKSWDKVPEKSLLADEKEVVEESIMKFDFSVFKQKCMVNQKSDVKSEINNDNNDNDENQDGNRNKY